MRTFQLRDTPARGDEAVIAEAATDWADLLVRNITLTREEQGRVVGWDANLIRLIRGSIEFAGVSRRSNV
jgi:hypothetical protein